MKINTGFTLIELMIVVIILAILAAIALPSYQAQVRRGNEKLALQQIADLSMELEKEKTRNFSYEGLNGKSLLAKAGTKTVYTTTVSAELRKWSIKSCVNQTLDDASLYKNFASNSQGATCEWSDTTCTVPSQCQ
ncbi:prepilin-type cleavage/methylation domain-containing protein [Acinetobacter sp. LoGeW2-3]|nr:prepilin-type N-terminal cleavage/methylation domain-containing protein [Acinetobacter sp. LoGeW2-3]ATO19435.1 prepilin-type cleavage/methylation domain-containing protein [Acinetobacter sp. LoGeW2-3]